MIIMSNSQREKNHIGSKIIKHNKNKHWIRWDGLLELKKKLRTLNFSEGG